LLSNVLPLQRRGALQSTIARTLVDVGSGGSCPKRYGVAVSARFRLGECAVDHRGGAYIGDAGFDFFNPLVDPIASGVIVYLGEMLGHRLTSIDIENNGSLRNRR
jgi:hypothetical protein